MDTIDWSKYGVDPNNELIPADVFLEQRNESNSESSGGVFKTLEDIRNDKLVKAQEENNYWDILSTDAQRFKADTNDNGRIEYEEYKQFILTQQEPITHVPNQNRHESMYSTNHHYSIDYTILIAIGMVCLTSIIISLLKRK